MKAFLLAAGLGTRLRPLTDRVPKCLVPINGKPLLDYWFDLFHEHGIDEVFLNLHHLPDQVREHVAQSPFRDRTRLFFEEQLLGSAGTVMANRDFVKDEEDFLICYADNLTDANLLQKGGEGRPHLPFSHSPISRWGRGGRRVIARRSRIPCDSWDGGRDGRRAYRGVLDGHWDVREVQPGAGVVEDEKNGRLEEGKDSDVLI